jgi:hypothetical protein
MPSYTSPAWYLPSRELFAVCWIARFPVSEFPSCFGLVSCEYALQRALACRGRREIRQPKRLREPVFLNLQILRDLLGFESPLSASSLFFYSRQRDSVVRVYCLSKMITLRSVWP